MYTKVSVLVPTRSRLEHLRAMLASFFATTLGAGAELLLRVDDDDQPTIDMLMNGPWPVAILVGPRLDGYRSLPAFYNELAAAATGDVLLIGNDDMVFATPGWPALVLEAANRYPDGLFNFGVRAHNEGHYPFSIVSRKAADRLGFLWDPRIFWGDIYLRDVMAAFGRCERLPSVEITHNWAGDEASQNQIYVRDPGYWEGTHARAVREAVAKLADMVAA